MNKLAIIICLITGLSFLIGYIINKLIKNKNNLEFFSISFAFVILMGLCFFDLLPECIENINNIFIILMYVSFGIIFLKSFDYILPHHEHSSDHLHGEHISLITFIAIFLHNILECFLIYMVSISNINSGILMAIGVMCHNIPLSISINTLNSSNKKNIIMTVLLILSSVILPLIFGIFNINIGNNVIGALTGVTLGMLIHITLFELLCEVKENYKNKYTIYGLVFGIVFSILIFLG